MAPSGRKDRERYQHFEHQATATASEKKNASFQSFFVTPLMTNTSGTMTSMNRIMSQGELFDAAVERGFHRLA